MNDTIYTVEDVEDMIPKMVDMNDPNRVIYCDLNINLKFRYVDEKYVISEPCYIFSFEELKYEYDVELAKTRLNVAWGFSHSSTVNFIKDTKDPEGQIKKYKQILLDYMEKEIKHEIRIQNERLEALLKTKI